MKLDQFAPAQVAEKNEINNMRKELGLSPVLTGFKNCLKCCRQFFSKDKKNNHICERCKESNERSIKENKW